MGLALPMDERQGSEAADQASVLYEHEVSWSTTGRRRRGSRCVPVGTAPLAQPLVVAGAHVASAYCDRHAALWGWG